MPSSPETMAKIRSGEEVGAAFTDAMGPRTDVTAESRLAGFRAGRDEGFEVGRQEGFRVAESNFDLAAGALQSAINDMGEHNRRNEARIESLAVELAVELAEAIVGGNIALLTSGDDVVARALRLRRIGEAVRIRLHPDDAALVDTVEHPGVEFVADPQLSPGMAHAELGEGFADLSTETAVARIREELS